jgi:type IV fimbrial biogenesis protein FimT
MNAPLETPHRRAPIGSARSSRPARGFTLVEMMTVVSILAVMLGIVAPSFGSMLDAQQAKALTYDLASDLMLARNEALKRNVTVAISRDPAGWQHGWTVSTLATNETLSHRNQTSRSVLFSSAPASIRFDPNGRVSAPIGSVRIDISGGQSYRCVELDPSGRVRSHTGTCS